MGQTGGTVVERAQRFNMTVPIHFRKAGMDHWLEGKTVNISRTGILFSTEEAIPANSILDVQVHFPTTASLKCQCTVVRADHSQVAIHLHHPSISHQL